MAASSPSHAAAFAAASGCSFRYRLLPFAARSKLTKYTFCYHLVAVPRPGLLHNTTPRQRQAAGSAQPAPCCLATSARSRFIGVMIANTRPKEQRRAVRLAWLRCAPRRWCCWLACSGSGSGRQAARMQRSSRAGAPARFSAAVVCLVNSRPVESSLNRRCDQHGSGRTPHVCARGLHVRVSLKAGRKGRLERKFKYYLLFPFH